MATTVRQPKPTRKGPTDTSRRPPAWSTGARASPTFTPPANFSRPARPATPSTQDRVLQNLAGLTGTTITLSTKTGQRYEAVIASTSGEGDTTGVTLKDVKELTNPGAPLKESLFIASTNIDNWSSGPADSKPTSNGSSFKTDVDISQQGREAPKHRELQAWKPSGDIPDTTLGGQVGNGDERTFGTGLNGGWDQFAVNEQLYGVKTQFDEELYTTKLDRTAADFKERERKAQRIANEIMGTASNNPHVAEERNQIVDDSGANEEDKYSTVVRGQNAYVPPGARKSGVTSPPAGNGAKLAAPHDIPKVSINGPDGVSIQEQQSNTPSTSSKAPSPAPSSTNSTKPPADPLPAFRDFVTNEKQRLTQKRQALVKSEMDKRMAELVKFSQSFKLNKPIPDDLVPILAKDEEKQKAIREKASKDAVSTQARAIGSAANTGPAPGARAPVQSSTKALEARKVNPPSTTASKTTTVTPSASVTPQKPSTASAKPNGANETSASKKPINMVIQAIPPFKGSKSRTPATASQANGSTQPQTPAQSSSGSVQPQSAVPLSPTSANNRLNVNASSFRPNPNASTFKPGAPSTTGSSIGSAASVSPKPNKTETTTPNAFFGSRTIKKSPPVNIKDDFNPFKHNKVAEASSIAAMWPYSGKRYIQMFPPPPHPPQQHSPHMGPPHGPPPMPPPPYEEDSNAARQQQQQQQQQQQYVYAYPPYGYPAQPMMPGMVPPGPPGAYVPGPFMQPMPYPPGMPPPSAMYHSPSMGQMPPPQAYMPPPPPPGTYPPPNGGPRPSMPPTPIPAHAHPYYHQSPQLQHAVPYPMMMPPPGAPNMPPHQYDQGPAPPVQMGGHA